MEVWIKITKHYQGGSNSTYMLVEPDKISTKERQEELMEQWGENSDGGHAYGYRVYMDILKDDEVPPKEWLEKEIKNKKSSIEYHERIIIIENNIISKYGSVLKKQYIRRKKLNAIENHE